MRVIIVGAGGHGQVVADSMMRAHECGAAARPVGYLDDDPAVAGRSFLGLPVLGPVSRWSEIPHDAMVVAIGENRIRKRLFQMMAHHGAKFAVVRHPSAVIAPDVLIGPGSMICAGAVVNPGSVIGANVILNTGCIVDHHNRIGDHVHIAPGVRLGGDVSIEEGVLVGIGATVMPQRQVGAWGIVGASALVHRDVPQGSMAVGVPARLRKGTRS
jgi:sugar O-acyltransferase (sialic acid O-acetyltransferase NeuD family)